MANCITCGTELHPERAKKYNYCMARECQEKNAKGLSMVAIGMNKAADEIMILDDRTREELATGKYRDQRRGSFGTSVPAPGRRPAPAGTRSSKRPPRPAAQPGAAQPGAARRGAAQSKATRSRRSTQPAAIRRPWTASQERLALLYNEQGLRPEEIAQKLGLSAYLVSQIILDARNRRKA